MGCGKNQLRFSETKVIQCEAAVLVSKTHNEMEIKTSSKF